MPANDAPVTDGIQLRKDIASAFEIISKGQNNNDRGTNDLYLQAKCYYNLIIIMKKLYCFKNNYFGNIMEIYLT